MAKAVSRVSRKKLFSPASQMVGTPLYMSPEQATGSPVDIDTRGRTFLSGRVAVPIVDRQHADRSSAAELGGLDEKLH